MEFVHKHQFNAVANEKPCSAQSAQKPSPDTLKASRNLHSIVEVLKAKSVLETEISIFRNFRMNKNLEDNFSIFLTIGCGRELLQGLGKN